jgi:hypothetical protein
VVCGAQQEDELHETVMIAMSEWCDERMRFAHAVDDRGLTFGVQYSVMEC